LLERARRVLHLVSIHKPHNPVKPQAPIYVLCNQGNCETIRKFLEENDFFGLDASMVDCFPHNESPYVDDDLLLMKSKKEIWTGPGGHGKVFQAMTSMSIYSEMRVRGLHNLYIIPSNNLASKIFDPKFIGYCHVVKATEDRSAGIKLTEKLEPDEGFGLLFRNQRVKDGKKTHGPALIESCEIPLGDAARKEPIGGQLYYRFASLCEFYIGLKNVDRFETAVAKQAHFIPKKVPYLSLAEETKGETIEPSPEAPPNCNHMVSYIGDIFDECDTAAGLVVDREEYMVIKEDDPRLSAELAAAKFSQLHQQWCVDAGGQFMEGQWANESTRERCEISPLVSFEGEGLLGYFAAGVMIPLPLHLTSEHDRPVPEQGAEPLLGGGGNMVQVDINRRDQFRLRPSTDMAVALKSAFGPRKGAHITGAWQQEFVGMEAYGDERLSSARTSEWDRVEEKERAQAEIQAAEQKLQKGLSRSALSVSRMSNISD